MEPLKIGQKTLDSRLFIGTGKYPSEEIIEKICRSSKAQVITVALRRVDLKNPKNNILNAIPKDMILLPNTSGATNAEEAVRIARLARAAGCGDWVKIEVISDARYLLPDNEETVKATRILASEGFQVFPYISPDLMTCKRLEEAGAACVMPLGAPIGSNRGLLTKDFIEMIIAESKLPVIVDAGIGAPSQAAQAMELGASACLVNTAIATAQDPEAMGEAFRYGVMAGRMAYEAKLGDVTKEARASSPLTGFLE